MHFNEMRRTIDGISQRAHELFDAANVGSKNVRRSPRRVPTFVPSARR
jgi:hypothetical protein